MSARSIAIALGGGLLVGVLTSFGQTVLPDQLRSLANGAGPWSAAAFALAVLAAPRGTLATALLAAGALLAMLAGYDLTSVARGFPISTATTLFWIVAAVVAGPVLGIGAAWIRGTDWRLAATLAAILVGEGVYGLTTIADSTSPGYWLAQVAVGLAVVAATALRLRSPAALGLGLVLTFVGAAAFDLVYANIGRLS
jgi:FtsH-binding integral membrane protein